MMPKMKTVLCACSPLFAVLVSASDAFARPAVEVESSRGATRCFSVRAPIATEVTTEDCNSVVQLCTRGYVSAGSGFLVGTTRFEGTGLGGGAVGEDSIVSPPAEPTTTWSYAGHLSVQTPVGRLDLDDIGVCNTARGTFAGTERVVGGTGLSTGATGDLFTFGLASAAGSRFDGTIEGKICIPTWR